MKKSAFEKTKAAEANTRVVAVQRALRNDAAAEREAWLDAVTL